jgi:glutamate synthase (NADPH/NADH) large chain
MSMTRNPGPIAPLYSPAYEHDSCGVGLVVDIAGRPSREIVEKALAGLVNLTHRGGVGADARTGDGAGLLIQVPHELFGSILAEAGKPGLAAGDFGVAMVFLPQDGAKAAEARSLIDGVIADRGLEGPAGCAR